MPDDAQLRSLARRRLGVVGSRHLEEAGFGASSIYRRIKSGALNRILPGVYILDGYPLGTDARALAAIEWAGRSSVASHRCCARLFHFDDAPEVVEITTAQKKGERRRGSRSITFGRWRLVMPLISASFR